MFKKQATAAKMTAELNQHLASPVSMIGIRRYFQKQNIYGKATFPMPLDTYVNVKLTKPGRYISGRKTLLAVAYVCVCDFDCILPTIKHGDGPALKGGITGEKYREVLADQIHPMMQILSTAEDGTFQNDNAPIHVARQVQSWFD
ncbi:DDE_3 domain-containing protein [Trichonephila clavipes]|nr:DDE_3 domain-containing protein [Trichonephila clavipes]